MNELQREILRELSYDSSDRNLMICILKIFKRAITDKAYQDLSEEDYLTISREVNKAIETMVSFSNLIRN